MTGQRFYANPNSTFTWANGAIGYRASEHDALGPFAKVDHCPIAGTNLTRTCYATAPADSYLSVPARCKVDGQLIKGYLSIEDDKIEFRPLNKCKPLIAKYCADLGLQPTKEIP